MRASSEKVEYPWESSVFLRAMACASLSPGLRSVLAFDCSPESLEHVKKNFAALWEATSSRPVEVLYLRSAETEDELWGSLVLKGNPQAAQAPQIVRQPGRLVQTTDNPRLIVIQDLARLSIAAARACVMLMGSETASLQRHGLDIVWTPNLGWLAACAREEIGQVSPHLLDRFALRLSMPTTEIDHSTAICEWIRSEDESENLEAKQTATPLLSEAAQRQLHQAAQHKPTLIPPALGRVLQYFPEPSGSTRRPVALSHLSRAIAQLHASDTVTTEHVDEAAAVVGLVLPVTEQSSVNQVNIQQNEGAVVNHDSSLKGGSEKKAPAEPPPEHISTVVSEIGAGSAEWSNLSSIPAIVPSEPESLIVAGKVEQTITDPVEPDANLVFTAVPMPPEPYPEDAAPVSREAEALRMPPRRYRASTTSEGPIIGTRRATNLEDLALVSTILEAAKFQRFRVSLSESHAQFSITRTDLRSYRRAPLPEEMLVLLLDYTCLQGTQNWPEALLSHLQWAYIERAAVCIVQVGANSAKNPLRAEQVTERSLLGREIGFALQSNAGIATPLAHGLEIALHSTRAALQTGRGSVQRVRFVVLSDGRGNVPIEASRVGALTWPVSSEGVEDALKIARGLRVIKAVNSFFLNPNPQQYAELPLLLAEELGVKKENIVTVFPSLPAVANPSSNE